MGISAILVALYLHPSVTCQKKTLQDNTDALDHANMAATAVPVAKVARAKFLLLRIAGNGGSLRDNWGNN